MAGRKRLSMATEGANPPACIWSPLARDLNGSVWVRDRIAFAWGTFSGLPRADVVQPLSTCKVSEKSSSNSVDGAY